MGVSSSVNRGISEATGDGGGFGDHLGGWVVGAAGGQQGQSEGTTVNVGQPNVDHLQVN
jgi:hypothetical protein